MTEQAVSAVGIRDLRKAFGATLAVDDVSFTIEQGVAHAVARFPYRGIGKAVAIDDYEGQAKLVFDPTSGAILGATVVGAQATELVHELLLASRSELRLEDIADTIHAHPTLSELVMETARSALGRAIHA